MKMDIISPSKEQRIWRQCVPSGRSYQQLLHVASDRAQEIAMDVVCKRGGEKVRSINMIIIIIIVSKPQNASTALD